MLVSVITPTYNRKEYLKDCIESVLAQSHQKMEHIIVDDGSTDGTEDLVKTYQEKSSSIRYFKIENTGKPAMVRNYALKKASGDYIAFLDSDDVWTANKIQKQLEMMNSEGSDICYSYAEIMNQSGVKSGEKIIAYKGNRIGNLKKELIFNSFIPMTTGLISRKLMGNFSFYEHVSIVDDYHMWITLALRDAKFSFLDDVTAFYRVHDEQISLDILRNIEETKIIFDGLAIRDQYPRFVANMAYAKLEVRKLKHCLLREKRFPINYVFSALRELLH